MTQNISFHPWHQVPRLGRPPRIGATCPIKGRLSVKFKPGKFLLKEINESKQSICDGKT